MKFTELTVLTDDGHQIDVQFDHQESTVSIRSNKKDEDMYWNQSELEELIDALTEMKALMSNNKK